MRIKNIFRNRVVTLGILIFFLVILILSRAPRFISPDNILRILDDTSILIIVAIGQFMVILTGGIDLSVGSIIAFSGMAASMVNQYSPETPIPIVLLIGIAIGLVLGIINGLLVSLGKVPPIITTLGTMSVYRGFIFVLSKGQWVTAHEMTEGFMRLPQYRILGITSLIWFALIISLILYFFMTYTRTGREIYAIGGNKTAALFVGIKEKKIQLLIFSINGLLCGLAGVMWTSRYAAAVNETAIGFELLTVAACVLGGVNIAGGSGVIPGVILGALFLGILNNALPVVNLSPFFQMGLQGLVVLSAMAVNTLTNKRNERRLRRRRLNV